MENETNLPLSSDQAGENTPAGGAPAENALSEYLSNELDELSLVHKGDSRNTSEDCSGGTSYYGTDIFTLLVGKDETPFYAHKGVLEKAPFFKVCCNRSFREKEEKLIRLPDEDPKDFTYVLDFLYAGYIQYHVYTKRRISDLDVFTDENLWYSPAWCPNQLTLHLWYPTPEHRSPIYLSPKFDNNDDTWDEEAAIKSNEEAKAHLDLLLRLYGLGDKFLMDSFRNHIVGHVLHAANYIEPEDFFEAVRTLYTYQTEIPPFFGGELRKYIAFFIKATDPNDDKMLSGLIAEHSRLGQEVVAVMRVLVKELVGIVDAQSRWEERWNNAQNLEGEEPHRESW